jgi:hypothetical protein
MSDEQLGANRGVLSAEPDVPLRIFLNYRRDDTAGHAGRLYDALVQRFGEEQVFMDIDRIPLGVDFVKAVGDAVGSCDVLIAMIGRGWLNIQDSQGRPRLKNPEDYVRLELEAALSRGVPVIPARVQDAEMPSSDELPDGLAPFARRNGLPLRDIGWREDVSRLMRALEGMAAEKAERGRAEEGRERAEREGRERAEREARERAEQEGREPVDQQMDANRLREAHASYGRGTSISTLAIRYSVDAKWLARELRAIDEQERDHRDARQHAEAEREQVQANARTDSAVGGRAERKARKRAEQERAARERDEQFVRELAEAEREWAQRDRGPRWSA